MDASENTGISSAMHWSSVTLYPEIKLRPAINSIESSVWERNQPFANHAWQEPERTCYIDGIPKQRRPGRFRCSEEEKSQYRPEYRDKKSNSGSDLDS